MAGSKEDAETVSAFSRTCAGGPGGSPARMVSDGTAGIVKASETYFPRSARQRCFGHCLRNLVAKTPEDLLAVATARFMDDFKDCIAHLRMPFTHRRAIRTTNLLERLFVEKPQRARYCVATNSEHAGHQHEAWRESLVTATSRWKIYCCRAVVQTRSRINRPTAATTSPAKASP